jgi:hypothetical protein
VLLNGAVSEQGLFFVLLNGPVSEQGLFFVLLNGAVSEQGLFLCFLMALCQSSVHTRTVRSAMSWHILRYCLSIGVG